MPSPQTPTADELREQITEAERVIADAQVELGQTTLEGKSAAAPAKAMQDARDQIGRARAALDELHRRETDAACREQLAAASARRQVEYEFLAELCKRIEAMLVAQEAARAAEDALMELKADPAGRRFRQCKTGLRLDSASVELDTDLVNAVPEFPDSPKRGKPRMPLRLPPRFTPERARELRGLAEERARQEAAGEGQDFSGVPSQRIRDRQAARQEAGRA